MSILQLSDLKAGAYSGLTLSGAFLSRLQRRGLAPSAGIQNWLKLLDSRYHGNDGKAVYKKTLNNNENSVR